MKRYGYSKVELVVVLGVVVLLSVITVPLLRVRRERNFCNATIKQLGLRIKQYLSDYDEKYPLVTANTGWAGQGIFPYVGDENRLRALHCPGEGTMAPAKYATYGDDRVYGDPMQTGYVDYWFNGHMAGLNEIKLQFPAKTVMLGEGNDGVDITDSRYTKTSLPPSWLTDTSKPSFRHAGGAHYVFADGHVAWLKPQEITTKPAATATNTFAVK